MAPQILKSLVYGHATSLVEVYNNQYM